MITPFKAYAALTGNTAVEASGAKAASETNLLGSDASESDEASEETGDIDSTTEKPK